MGRKKKKKEEHPTLFVLEGSILNYEGGSILELHTQITPEEWRQIVTETVQYSVFIECLKSTAIPILREPWTPEDEWFRIQMGVAIDRMKAIDPLLVSSINVDELRAAYVDKMKRNAEETMKMARDFKLAQMDKQSRENGLSNL